MVFVEKQAPTTWFLIILWTTKTLKIAVELNLPVQPKNMEEWLNDPVRMQWEEQRQSRRASNANSRAASRMQSPRQNSVSKHGSVRIINNYSTPNVVVVDSSSRHVVVENASRFPLSNSTLNLLTERYFRNLGMGETTHAPVDQGEVIEQPAMTDVSDDPVGLFLAEEDLGDMIDQDLTFFNNVSRSLKMAKQAKKCEQNEQRGIANNWPNMTGGPALSASSKMESQSQRITIKNHSSERTSITDGSLHHSSNPTSTRVPFTTLNSSKHSSNKTVIEPKITIEKAKAPSKSLLWPSRSSRAIANDSDPIATYHDPKAPQTKEPTTKMAQSTIRKFTRALGRMFTKSD